MKQFLCLFILMLIATTGYTATYEITKTVDSTAATGPGDYATIAIAEAAWDIDLVAGDSSITLDVTGAQLETGTVTIDGANTNATHFLTVTASGSARQNGIYNTSRYRIVSTSEVLSVDDDYVVLDGIQLKSTGGNGIASGADYVIIKNTIIEGWAGSSSTFGVLLGTDPTLYNCLFNDWENYVVRGSGVVTVIGCTFDNCGANNQCVYGGYLSSVVRNCIFMKSDNVGTDKIGTATNNATDAASITYVDCGGCGANDVYSIDDPFADTSANNFFPIENSDINGVGIALGPPYDEDGVGVIRGDPTDIGFLEFVATGGDPLRNRRRIEILRGL